MRLLEPQKLGLGSMILMGINGSIGSGIFLLPGKVMGLAGSWSLVVYGFVSLLCLAIGWCFARCAALFTRNGGPYIYAKEAFGEFIGFEIGIMRWAVGIIAWASIAAGFATALSAVWSQALQEPTRSILVLSLVGGLGIINILGLKMVKGLNNVVSISKVVPLLVFVLAGIFFVKQSQLMPDFNEEISLGTFGSAAVLLFYAFGGFETLSVAAEDMRNPKKNLPLAMMSVILICSILYFLIQWIAMGLLGEQLAHSEAPIADAMHVLAGPIGKWAVTIVMLVSIGGVNIAASFLTPRGGVALAEDRLIPSFIGSRSRFGTPYMAIIITVAAVAAIALSGSFSQLVMMSVVSRFAQYLVTCAASMVLYRGLYPKEKAKRTILFAVPFIAMAGLVWLLFHASAREMYIGLGGLVIGVPAYFIQKWVLQAELNKPLPQE